MMCTLIVGAGIAGLSLAAHLKRFGMEPVVIDNAPEWKPLGFVIGLWENGSRTLEPFDVYSHIKDVVYFPSAVEIRNAHGKILKSINGYLLSKERPSALLIKRSDFHSFLLSINEYTDIRLGTSVTNIEQSPESANVTFTDGSTASFDLVVGADGIDSQVRQLVFGDIKPVQSGVLSWLHMAPKTAQSPTNVVEIWHEDLFFGVYPHNGNQIHTIFACKDGHMTEQNWTMTGLKELFSDFGWIVPSVLQSMHSESELHCREWQEVDAPEWHKGKVVLIGDAAHAMVPTFGMGANVALEDSFVLAEELSKASSIEDAAAAYLVRRQPRVAEIKETSRRLSHFLTYSSPIRRVFRDAILRVTPTSAIEDSLRNVLAKPI